MDLWLIWIIVGFALVIAELVTGTFYLLVLGVAAFLAAIAAWLGANLLVQATVGSALSIAGAWWVHHWHETRRRLDGDTNFLDRGQAVVLDGWANEQAGIARVKYRGALWDARLMEASARPTPGSTLYIEGQDGSTLLVRQQPQ
ncbi:MAG TPA: NfeD family protein [Usitatibacter sp.]|nr:NfeD family protein [Usitatibacter sp.]